MILPNIVFKGAPGVLASPFAMPGFGTLTAYGATAPGGTIKPQLISQIFLYYRSFSHVCLYHCVEGPFTRSISIKAVITLG